MKSYIKHLIFEKDSLVIKKGLEFIHTLNQQKMDTFDWFKMQVNYGSVGNLFTRIKAVRPWVFGKCYEKRNLILTLNNEKDRNSKSEESILYPVYNSDTCENIDGEYPRISIITPNFNQGYFLEDCIRSVLSQNYPNAEYIIIDGGSTDNSLQIIKEYENSLTFWETEENKGDVDLINKGLKSATGDIFNWLNANDRLAPHALYRCAESYQQNKASVGWIGAYCKIDFKGNILQIIFPNGLDMENMSHNWNGGQFAQPSAFLSTAKVKEIGGINPDANKAFCHDLWVRLLQKGEFSGGKGIWSASLAENPCENAKPKKSFLLQNSRKIETPNFYRHGNLLKSGKDQKDKCDYTIPNHLFEKLERTRQLFEIDTDLFKSPSTVVFISNHLPRFDKTSANLRLSNILEILLANKCKIEYIYCKRTRDDARYLKAFEGSINFLYLPLDQNDYHKTVVNNDPEYVWITNLWSIDYVTFMAKLTKALKKERTSFKVLIDTMDFHAKEFFRKYEWTRNRDDLTLANEFLKNEKILYEESDTVIVISEDEKRDIQGKIESVADIEIVPNIHQIPYSVLPHSKRRNLCFVGHFGNKHNIDAVRHFLDSIFPLILNRHPRVEFHVIGYLAENYQKEFRAPNVRVIGSVKNLQKALSYYMLFVCPMTYGAGMKGKIGSAIEAGVPVVTTTIGAEGFPARDGEECFISDDPIEFAEKCNQVLRDPVLWHNFSVKSRLMLANHFSPYVIAKKLKKILQK